MPINAFWDELKRRMENPFWGSFIISWLLINWKVVYITISLESTSIDDKINYIEKLYQSWIWGNLISLIIYPLLASFIAVALIPFINHFYLWLRKFHRDRDATLEIQEIQKEQALIKERQILQKEGRKLEKSQEEIWNEDYDFLMKKDKEIFEQLSIFIHIYGWKVNYGMDLSYNNSYKQPTYLKIFNSYDLVKISKRTDDLAIYEPTEKWKYFLKKQLNK